MKKNKSKIIALLLAGTILGSDAAAQMIWAADQTVDQTVDQQIISSSPCQIYVI